MIPNFDPFDAVRRRFAQELARQEQRIVDAVLGLPGAALDMAQARASELVTDGLLLLGRLSHAAADAIMESSRGPNARALTVREQRLVQEAWGNRVPPARVRIVAGPGNSKIALAAFLKGNPAITLGNTIFIKTGLPYIRYQELPMTFGGLELLLHEYTHVVQWATMGYTAFAGRYAAELRAHGGDADKLYRYEERNLPFNGETLEGQAQIVGDLAAASRRGTPADVERVRMLRAKLRGTGVYGQ